MQMDYYRFDREAAIRAESQLYFDTLTKAALLGDKLTSHALQSAANIFYRISDPNVINNLALPTELPSDRVESVRIEFDEITNDIGTTADSRVVIEFDEGSECHIPIPNRESGDTITYSVVPSHSSTIWRTSIDPGTKLAEIMEGTIGRQEVSNLIARSTLPDFDPTLADFLHLDTQEVRDVIKETLEETDYVEIDKVLHFEFEDRLITVSTQNGYTREICVEESSPGDDTHTTALRTELGHFSHTQEVVVYQNGRSLEPRPAFPDELRSFNYIISSIIAKFEITSESIDSQVEQARRKNYLDSKAPEEREGFL